MFIRLSGQGRAIGETEDSRGQGRGHRRKQILDAALVVFSRKGYGEATIPDIAMEAGVAVGTIYHYYESKHDLLVSLVRTYGMTGPLGELFALLTKEDERTSVQAIIENGLDWGADDLKAFLFVFTEVLRDPSWDSISPASFWRLCWSLWRSMWRRESHRATSATLTRRWPREPYAG